jgi:fumarate hydratase subunit beta
MDPYTPALLDLGMRGMIGKSNRSPEVIEAMKRNHAVYFAVVGGVAALVSKSIKKSEVICYEDLGTEAIHKYYVEDFPAIVVIDTQGNNAYITGVEQYKQK